jgi:hypothetical protein
LQTTDAGATVWITVSGALLAVIADGPDSPNDCFGAVRPAAVGRVLPTSEVGERPVTTKLPPFAMCHATVPSRQQGVLDSPLAKKPLNEAAAREPS